MAREIYRLVAHAFLEAAVARDDESAMVDQLVAIAHVQHALGERHADRRRDPLPERTRRRFDAERMAIFRMAGGRRTELPKILDLLDPHVGIAEQMMDRILQHRTVAGRQHEPVAVRPCGIGGIDIHELREQHSRDISHAHRHAGMAGLGLLDSIHRQRAKSVGAVAHGCGCCGAVERISVGHGVSLDWSRRLADHLAARARSTSRKIIGVRMSCMARSSLSPGMTIELARVIQLPWIIATR